MATANRTPYLRLSGFYFFYFASLGAFLPYWGLYLQELGFEAEAIGELMAVVMATKIIAPNIWGWIADRFGKRLRIIRIATFLSAASFAFLVGVSDYWWIMLVLALFSFFWNAALPQFEATTLNHLGEGTHHYSKIRVWGSIGFIVAVLAFAPVFDRFGIHLLPITLVLLLAAIWFNTLLVSEHQGNTPQLEHVRLGGVIMRPEVLALLATCFFAQASHGPYYTFFSIYLEDHGYSRQVIGGLWALGVIAEVLIFLLMHRWLPRFGAGKLLVAALMITVVRWLLIATQVRVPVLVIAQTMHAASFGVFHASAIHLTYQFFPGRLQGRGQALYSSLSFGLGGAVGSIASGYVWTDLGAQWAYLMAAAAAAIALLVAWGGLRSR